LLFLRYLKHSNRVNLSMLLNENDVLNIFMVHIWIIGPLTVFGKQ